MSINKKIISETYTWKEYIKSLGFFLGEYKKRYFFWFGTIFIVYFYFLIPPFIVGEVINLLSINKKEFSPEIIDWILLLTFSSALISLIRLNAKKYLSYYGVYASYNIKTLGFQEIINRSLSWHEKENTGSKVTKIQNASTAYKESLYLIYQEILPLISQLVGIIFIFVFLEINLLVFSILYILLFFLTHFLFLRKTQLETLILSKLKEESAGTYFETVSNLNLVKNFDSKHINVRVINNEEKVKEQELKLTDLINLKWKTFQVINSLSLGLFLYLLISSFYNNNIFLGTIFPLFTYFNKLTDTLGSSTHVTDNIIELKISCSRIKEIFSDYIGDSKTEHFPNNWKKLSFQTVFFSYNNNQEYALEDFSINIKKGSFIGISGKSGSGKSTLSKLLLGHYNPTKGSVLIENTQVNNILNIELRKKIAVVPQESELLNMSIKDNITLLKEVPQLEIDTAIKIAELTDLIDKLPLGINTIIGEKGYKISGGERQRIAIARAIITKPEILILDESTSALNVQLESKIQNNIEEKLTNITLIVIAHRTQTLVNADEIYYVENGKIKEQGTFKQLMKNTDSSFYKYNSRIT